MYEKRRIARILVMVLCFGAFLWQLGVAAAAEPRYEFIKVDTTKYKKHRPWKIGFSNASV
ncbi:MAG: hypothetical protein JRH07_04010, partial [Deltaproteobacteria bacterium]|nr:hypothetical protein [Deltaproteobacteria bacterium]